MLSLERSLIARRDIVLPRKSMPCKHRRRNGAEREGVTNAGKLYYCCRAQRFASSLKFIEQFISRRTGGDRHDGGGRHFGRSARVDTRRQNLRSIEARGIVRGNDRHPEGENLTDTRATLFSSYAEYVKMNTINRPRTLGVRFPYKFADHK